MVDFVDAAKYVHFTPGAALRTGFEKGAGSINAIMWPNAIVDTGQHLRHWLPKLKYEPHFPIKTIEPAASLKERVILYASSEGTNKNWFADRHPDFWRDVAVELGRVFGQRPLLIGSAWDAAHCAPLLPHCDSVLANTSLRAVAGLLEHARGVVGVASGMTILANVFRTPAVALFPDRHAERFPWAWLADDCNAYYRVTRARDMSDARAAPEIVEALASLARGRQ